MSYENFRFEKDTFDKNSHCIGKICHEVLMVTKV